MGVDAALLLPGLLATPAGLAEAAPGLVGPAKMLADAGLLDVPVLILRLLICPDAAWLANTGSVDTEDAAR